MAQAAPVRKFALHDAGGPSASPAKPARAGRPGEAGTTDFDDLIVDAGTAGCVLAARLSEDPDLRVGPVEADGGARAMDAWRAQELLPGPQVAWKADRLAFLERTAFTHRHPVGTCRRGVDTSEPMMTFIGSPASANERAPRRLW